MTKKAFFTALRPLLAKYPWAADAAKLDHAMSLVEKTLNSTSSLVSIDGPSFVEAWRAIGGKGKPTFKALRALPAE